MARHNFSLPLLHDTFTFTARTMRCTSALPLPIGATTHTRTALPCPAMYRQGGTHWTHWAIVLESALTSLREEIAKEKN